MILKASYSKILSEDKSLSLLGLMFYVFPLLNTGIKPFILIAFSSNYRAAERDLCVKCPSLLKRCRINYVFAMEQVIDPQNSPSRTEYCKLNDHKTNNCIPTSSPEAPLTDKSSRAPADPKS